MTDVAASLDPRIQRWMHRQGWTGLRQIQLQAIPAVLAGDCDLLISSATASGKTEAFFLPACSAVLNKPESEGFDILYISPLKALINDQHRRLSDFGAEIGMQVIPWHGDVSITLKNTAQAKPGGILLITPESLESLFINKTDWVKRALKNLHWLCIDEFHAFVGTERGQQLISQLGRLEHLIGRIEDPIPRVGLSATLGELGKVAPLLRPSGSLSCKVIADTSQLGQLQMEVKGFTDPADPAEPSAEEQICQVVYRTCRGKSNLVFANSRQRTESMVARLSDLSEGNFVPNEFFVHHGSLAKGLREELEARLQKDALPTTAVCTMTLELGIDIGKVNTVVQANAPQSVASLRQRLGRSGRRGDPAILRMLIAEPQISASANIADRLRLELVQTFAMARLLVMRRWFEPAAVGRKHYSTLLHQVLAVVAQWGSARIDQLFMLLTRHGPFGAVKTDEFKTLLRGMGDSQLLRQLGTGELVLDSAGERLVNSHTFYAVFKVQEEFRIVAGNKSLGTLPMETLVLAGQHIVFGGRYWKVVEVDAEARVIHVIAAQGGSPPAFGGSGIAVHDEVRREMLAIYQQGDYRILVDDRKVDYADDRAAALFREGVDFFRQSGLVDYPAIKEDGRVYVTPWMGDRVANALAAVLSEQGLEAGNIAGIVEVPDSNVAEVSSCLLKLAKRGFPEEQELARKLRGQSRHLEKHDKFVANSILQNDIGMKVFDCESARKWVLENLQDR